MWPSPKVPCPGQLRNYQGLKGSPSTREFGAQMPGADLVLNPVVSLSSCATLAKPPDLWETQSHDITLGSQG